MRPPRDTLRTVIIILEIEMPHLQDHRARARSSPRASRRAREREGRREDVLAAAQREFAERGFHGAQMGEIAARAEISLASIYQLVSSKDELFEAVIERAARAMRAEVEARVAAIEDPGARLLGLVDALFACFESNQDLLRIYASATQGIPLRARATLGEGPFAHWAEFRRYVTSVARAARGARALRGLDPEAVALCVIGSVMFSATHAIESGDARALAAAAPRVRAVLARALGEPGTGT
jgi:AcrR family transcriptional regulator